MIVSFNSNVANVTMLEISRMFKECFEHELIQALNEPFYEDWSVEYEKRGSPEAYMKFIHKGNEHFMTFQINFTFVMNNSSYSVNVEPHVVADIKNLAEARYVADMLRQFETFKKDIEQRTFHRPFRM